jgi:hypothetical protein
MKNNYDRAPEDEVECEEQEQQGLLQHASLLSPQGSFELDGTHQAQGIECNLAFTGCGWWLEGLKCARASHLASHTSAL